MKDGKLQSAIIKDSELVEYLMKHVVQGSDVRYIDSEGNTSSWISPEPVAVAT